MPSFAIAWTDQLMLVVEIYQFLCRALSLAAFLFFSYASQGNMALVVSVFAFALMP